MRQRVAFRFIPELIGDISHVAELSKSPGKLYIETALSALRMASEVFAAFMEHVNTRKVKEVEQTLLEEYSEIEKKRINNREEEAIRILEIRYERLKLAITEERFRVKEVREFIACVQEELLRTVDCLKTIQIDPSFKDKDRAEEALRRSLRAYIKISNLLVEEDKNDDK